MPVFLDGQQNLAALSVPGVYGDIILPTPILLGTPTNIEGLVGVASWGPLNSIIPVSKPSDGALALGPPQIRQSDIMSYVSFATQLGSAIGFYCVRVSDGTDTAAATAIGTGGTFASATASFSGNPTVADTLVINGSTYTFNAGNLGSTLAKTLQILLTELQNSNDTNFSLMNYTLNTITNVLTITSKLVGTAGNAYTLTKVSSVITLTGGGFLAGGLGTGGTGITITGKYSGTLGNSVSFNIVNGSAAGSFMAIVSFPGSVPEQFNNISNTLLAAGAIVTTSPNIIMAATIPSWVTPGMAVADVTSGLSIGTVSSGAGSTTLVLTGNAAHASSTNNDVLSFGTGNQVWVNMANAINSGTAYHGPSQYVVAVAGSSTAAPTVAAPQFLVGGTDGTAGVTFGSGGDAILMGQDIVPRKGMFALRSSGVDCFTLCDLSTYADYAAIGSFGLSETCLPVFGSPSGDTIANALATRINAGIDTPWFWYILGDWPSWYDSYNQVSRIINPSAAGIGICGNLSPQVSPLNKPLQGISATQRTTLGQTYSETELSQINLGGIDTILGPQTSPGGYFFSFATARNASSNTAANEIVYTRLTNFLIRAAQSKAAGSFVGQLQSIQPNDQTRANAKALFDGFSAQLASPQVGLGINGQGMIDIPWLVICDLTNNPANLQALGYLFLYWQVRYLNVIRYFVVKFQGGGNVTVSAQNTLPTAAQFSSGVNTTI